MTNPEIPKRNEFIPPSTENPLETPETLAADERRLHDFDHLASNLVEAVLPDKEREGDAEGIEELYLPDEETTDFA